MNVLIAGDRNFDDYEKLEKTCDYMLSRHRNNTNLTILSWGTAGACQLAEKYATQKNIKWIRIPVYESNGDNAGKIRNQTMALVADALIVFWDGESKESKHMIGLCEEFKLKLKVIRYKE